MTLAEAFSLLGGVGLFLFGMSIMSTGLKNACGDNLQNILEKATKNRVIAVCVGLGMTLLIQSSSATDVMVIGFVNSGMMKLSQAIGVIMGANIGTTITAQITAFNISTFTPLMICAGAIMYLFIKKAFVKHVGTVIMGFGMLFQGITLMKAAIAPLSQSQTFIDFLSGLGNPVIAVLFGIAFTALLQSSSSSTVIFQAFAVQGLITYDMAVYLVIGAAIGSVTPNLLAALTSNRNGKRSAILNLIFNLLRAALLIVIINVTPLTDLIQKLSPNDVGRQVANTHTIFAIIAVLVMLPFTKQIVKISEKLIPVKEEEKRAAEDRSLVYMNQLSNVPIAMAVHQTHLEVTRLGRICVENFTEAVEVFLEYDEKKAERVKSREQNINSLYHKISNAMLELQALNIDAEHLRRVSMLTIATTDMERVSDHAENIVEYIENLRNKKGSMSEVALEELRGMSADTISALELSIDIFSTENYSLLDKIEKLEDSVDKYEHDLVNAHVKRLMHNECDPLAGVVFSDIVTDFERCADHAINIAYALKERPASMNK